jgi:cytoplasmic iron level regulating protein YaaA (DUF328/UPF0246 family)
MSRIVLISCASRKKSIGSPAGEMYQSQLFRSCMKYARLLKPDRIMILSAKYGLLGMEDYIEPYNMTLNSMSDADIRAWSDSVVESLRKVSDLNDDEFIFLAGQRYRKYLIPHLGHYDVPMQGLGIGKQLKFLKERVENEQGL